MKRALSICLALAVVCQVASAADNVPPEGFTALFNGKDFTGWHGMPHYDPVKLANLPEEERAKLLAAWNEDLLKHWKVENGVIINDGHGVYLSTDKAYSDFELYVDYKMFPKGDSGLYLKNAPQVQIWDFTQTDDKLGPERAMGSGGLWNNSPGKPGKDPLVKADKPLGEWNTFRVVQVGARTSVWLNGKLVVDNAIMENYFDRKKPLLKAAGIQLQTHGSEIQWKNIYLREIPSAEANEILRKGDSGFTSIFNGKDFTGWQGGTDSYEVVDGVLKGKTGKGGVLFTDKAYEDFVVRLDFKLPPAGNNGLAIRYPGTGGAAFDGMTEVQILDSEHEKYSTIDPRQAHGSVYGMIPAVRGYLRPTGEWNYQVVTVQGPKITVELNGSVILDGDVSTVKEFMGNTPHPGKDLTKGHFGFAGHNDPVEFRNIEIKELPKTEAAAK